MADYAGQTTAQAPTSQSLVSDSGAIFERLTKVLGHLIDLNNKLHGSQPRDTGLEVANKTEPEATVRRNLDRAIMMLSKVENELEHIDARV